MGGKDLGQVILIPENLLMLYRAGFFPMAQDRDDPDVYPVETLESNMRAEIPLDAVHLAQSFSKVLRKEIFRVTVDQSFEEVIRACAEPERRKEGRTWINDTIIEAYINLHKAGHAHSIECRDADGKLAGGLYGVRLGQIFFGESIFNDQPDAGKVALINLVARLRRGGFRMLETQMVTPLTESFGGRRILLDAYRQSLRELQDGEADFALPGLDQKTILHDYLSEMRAK